MNSGVSTPSELLKAEERGEEVGLVESLEWSERLGETAALRGGSNGRRWYGKRRVRALRDVVCRSFFPPGAPRLGLGLGELKNKELRS